jgi:hypothetical protein
MNRKAVLENVRRYRAIASLYRQTASFRPCQSWSLLEQARDWERRALAELEFYFESIGETMQHFSDLQLRVGDVRSLG